MIKSNGRHPVQWWIPLVAMLSFAAAAVIIWQALAAREREHLRRLVAAEADSVKDQIAANVHAQLFALLRMAQRQESWAAVQPKEIDLQKHWSRDAELYVQHRQGYRAVALVDSSYDVFAVVPIAGNKNLLGSEFGELPRVQRTLEDARRTRDPKVSQPIELPGGDKGFVVAVPMFPEEEFGGLVMGIFNLSELLDSILQDDLASGFHIAVFDASRPDLEALYRSDPTPAETLHEQAAVNLDGVPWAIHVWPQPTLLARERTILPEVTLAAGLLVAFLLGAALYEFQKARASTRWLAATHDHLLRTEQRHQQTLENCLDAFVAIDQQGNVREWNQQAVEVFGWPREEVLGRPVRDFIIPPEQQEAHQRGLRHFLSTGDGPLLNRRIEVDALRRDGTRFPVELTITPVETAAGFQFTAFLRDITQRKKAEEELRLWNETLENRVAERTGELRDTLADLTRAKEAAEDANRAKSSFLANMSHEIRTPLNAVIGMTELVLDGSLSDEQREYLQMIQASGESLLTVINDILDFSKIEAGRLDLEDVPFNHAELLGNTMKSLGVRAADKGLELIVRIEPDVPTVLSGDEGRLRQVLNNLVGNAVKFTEDGEVVVDVSLDSPTAESIVIHYAIRDTGIGIPHDKLDKMFEAFEQADLSTTRRFGGTGLGLPISSRLVEMMEGRLWAESREGRGSTFHFTARFNVPTEQPPAMPSADREAICGLPALVVDDNATNRRLIHDLLLDWGMLPIQAESANEALNLLREAQQIGRPPRLAICDAHMPHMGGLDLVRRIRQESQYDDLRIIMLSSGERPGERSACNDLNIAAHILKPIKQSELLDAVLAALGAVAEHEPQAAEQDDPSETRCLKVLLAEDSLVNQRLALALLSKSGHRVDVANNGREAVRRWKDGKYDLLLMDVQMPEMDGLEATQSIRALEEQQGRHTPIIAMTAHALKGDRERCLEAGMDEYIAKPIRRHQLLAAIERVSGLRVEQEPRHSVDEADASHKAEGGLVDWQAALKNSVGDPALLKDLAQVCLRESAALLDEMRAAVAAGNTGDLMRTAHTLKSHARIFGAAVPEHLALHIENTARDSSVDVGEAIDNLQTNFEKLHEELRDFLAGRISSEEVELLGDK